MKLNKQSPDNPQLLNQFAAEIDMNPHDLRIHATDELITLSAAATHFGLEDKVHWVDLVPRDILGSLNKDYIEVTCIVVNGEEFSDFDNPVTLRDGLIYVSEIERIRFKQSHAEGKDPIYHVFDVDHPNYSESLDAALSAWMLVCDTDQQDKTSSMKQQVKKWLKANYRFSDGMHDNIAAVVNPHKNGGRAENIDS